jgi:hypothetical protein
MKGRSTLCAFQREEYLAAIFLKEQQWKVVLELFR